MDQTPINKLRQAAPGKTPLVLLSAGSFNPMTHGHLWMMELVRNYIADSETEDVIGGYFSPVNDAYKKKGMVHHHYRVEMGRLALQSSDWAMLDAWEAKQVVDQPVPTIDVINHLQDFLSFIPGVRVSFVCGADLLESFTHVEWWTDKEVDDIFAHGVYVVGRGDVDMPALMNSRPALARNLKNMIPVNAEVPIGISSTYIRKLLTEGKSIRYLVPDPVVDYIDSERFYPSP